MTLYAISNRVDTPAIVCKEHLRAALEEWVTHDAYLLDFTLLNPTDPATCDNCKDTTK